jgi:hypothetical protein
VEKFLTFWHSNKLLEQMFSIMKLTWEWIFWYNSCESKITYKLIKKLTQQSLCSDLSLTNFAQKIYKKNSGNTWGIDETPNVVPHTNCPLYHHFYPQWDIHIQNNNFIPAPA